MAKLNPAQLAKQKEKLAQFHENGKKGLANTSAGSVKPPRTLSTVRLGLTPLLADCNNVIKQAVIGGLVPEREVWKGNPEELQAILDTDPSASIEDFTLDNGKVVKVLVRYTSPDSKRIDISKWTITQEINLKKAMDDSKNRKLDLALKKQLAEDKGAIPKENAQEKAKALAEEGKHIKPVLNNFSLHFNEDEYEAVEEEDETE